MATAYWDDERVKDRNGFWHLGHRPTLIAAFLYFDLAFMVWVLLGPLAPEIAKTLHLSAAQKGLMVATPTLAGAILRLVNGLLVDRIGPKRAGAISQIVVIAGLLVAWAAGVNSFAVRSRSACMLGLCRRELRDRAAAGQPLVSARASGQGDGACRHGQFGHRARLLVRADARQIVRLECGAGPRLHPAHVRPLLYLVMAKDAPNAPAPKPMAAYLQPLRSADAWWLMAFYRSPSVAFRARLVALRSTSPISSG
jgi:NNP family nitrate/nitrite transporter-like MFS transporter